MRTPVTLEQAGVLMEIATLKRQANTHKGHTLKHAATRKGYLDKANKLASTLPGEVRVAFIAPTADGPEYLQEILNKYATITK